MEKKQDNKKKDQEEMENIKLGALNIAGIPAELRHLNKSLIYDRFIKQHQMNTIIETGCVNKVPNILDD